MKYSIILNEGDRVLISMNVKDKKPVIEISIYRKKAISTGNIEHKLKRVEERILRALMRNENNEVSLTELWRSLNNVRRDIIKLALDKLSSEGVITYEKIYTGGRGRPKIVVRLNKK